MLSDGSPIPVVLLANKCDIAGVNIPTDSINRLCREAEINKWFLTSAKDNKNVGELTLVKNDTSLRAILLLGHFQLIKGLPKKNLLHLDNVNICFFFYFLVTARESIGLVNFFSRNFGDVEPVYFFFFVFIFGSKACHIHITL